MYNQFTTHEIQRWYMKYYRKNKQLDFPSFKAGIDCMVALMTGKYTYVAEVVKCGDVNKINVKTERRNKLIQQLSRRNPTRSPEYILRKVDAIMNDKTIIHTLGFSDENSSISDIRTTKDGILFVYDPIFDGKIPNGIRFKPGDFGIGEQSGKQFEISNDHPQEWFDEMFRKGKITTDDKKIVYHNNPADRQRLIDDLKQEAAELGMSGSRKDIKDMVTKCDHKFTILYDTGYTCMKCGQWINRIKE